MREAGRERRERASGASGVYESQCEIHPQLTVHVTTLRLLVRCVGWIYARPMFCPTMASHWPKVCSKAWCDKHRLRGTRHQTTRSHRGDVRGQVRSQQWMLLVMSQAICNHNERRPPPHAQGPMSSSALFHFDLTCLFERPLDPRRRIHSVLAMVCAVVRSHA